MRLSKLTIFLLTFAVAVLLPLKIRGQANKANGPSNYALIGPGGGTDPGTPPTCNPDLEPCYCDPEFSPGEQLRCYEPVTPPSARSAAHLRCRHVLPAYRIRWIRRRR